MNKQYTKNFTNSYILWSKLNMFRSQVDIICENWLNTQLKDLKQDIYELLTEIMSFITNESKSLSAYDNKNLLYNYFVLLCEFYDASIKMGECKDPKAIVNIMNFKEKIIDVYNQYGCNYCQRDIDNVFAEFLDAVYQTSELVS